MNSTASPLILKNIYHLKENEMGMTMSISSFCTAISTGFLISPIIAFLHGNLITVIKYSLYGMSILFMIQGLLESQIINSYFNNFYFSLQLFDRFQIYFILSILQSLFQYALSNTLTGESTSRVGPNSKGLLLGTEHSLFAAARIASPQIGVYLLQTGGITAVSGMCAGVFFIMSVLWMNFDGNNIKFIYSTTSNACERKER